MQFQWKSGSDYSKGMVIINRKPEDNDSRFLINIFDEHELIFMTRKSQASFIKKSMELSILSDSKSILKDQLRQKRRF